MMKKSTPSERNVLLPLPISSNGVSIRLLSSRIEEMGKCENEEINNNVKEDLVVEAYVKIFQGMMVLLGHTRESRDIC